MSELSNIATFWLGSCSKTDSAVKNVQQWGIECTKGSNDTKFAVPRRDHIVTPTAEFKHPCRIACGSK